MKKEYSLNTFLPLILFSAIALVVLVLFLAPTIFKAFKTYRELGNLKTKILTLSKKAEILEKINLEDLKDKESRINYYIPSNKDVSVLMDSISEITNGTNISFESMKLAPGDLATPSGKLAERDLLDLEVSISLAGDLPSFLKFIENTKKASPVIKILTINISKKARSVIDQGPIRPYAFSIVLVTYYKPISGSFGKISDQVKTLSEEDNKYLMSLTKPPATIGSAQTNEVNYNSGRTDPFSRF